jgi:mannose-6-phosphate isomerase-like protein (cupin superfamily)
MSEKAEVTVRNIAELPWHEFPGHFGGALSKLLTPGAKKIDHRISSYAPKAHVARHKHDIEEQVFHVLEGQGLFEYGDTQQLVGPHDVMFVPPGVEHAFTNTGLSNLVFLVITTPPLPVPAGAK